MSQQPLHFVKRVVSGGQTGVDRGALLAAIELGIDHGGWCPRGRLAEDGRIPSEFKLKETPSKEYRVRTEKNVTDSDATLILFRGEMSGGTVLTYRLAKQHCKPCLCVDLENGATTDQARQWLIDEQIETLNVAGPRESGAIGICAETCEFMTKLLSSDA